MWATVIGGLCGNFSRDLVFFLSKALIMVVAVNILTCRFFHVTLTIESYLISACLVIFFFPSPLAFFSISLTHHGLVLRSTLQRPHTRKRDPAW